MAVAESQRLIESQLKFINSSYLKNFNSPYAGNIASNTDFAANTPNIGITNIFHGYDSSVTAFTSVAATTTPNVYLSIENSSTPTSVAIANWSNIKTTANLLSINCMALYSTGNINVLANTSVTTRTFVSALYLLHGALDNAAYSQLKTNTAVNVNIPNTAGSLTAINISLSASGNGISSSTSGMSSIITTANNILNMKDVVSNDIDAFVLRRLIYTYITMCNYNVAMSFYNASHTSSSANTARAKDLVEALYLIMARANFFVTNVDGTEARLNARVKKRQDKYQNNVATANDIADDLESSKLKLTETSNKLSTNNSINGKVQAFVWTAMILLVVVCVTGAGLVLYPFEERKTRVLASLLLILFTIIIAITLQLSYSKVVVETFTSLATFPKIASNISLWTDIEDSFNENMLSQANDFLANTVTVYNSLATYKAYGNVNTSMQRELSYFKATNDRIENGNLKTGQASNLVVLSSAEQTSRMYLCVSLMVILALTLAAFIGTEDYPGARKGALGVGALLAIVAFIFYILESNARVHTDGKKYYWGNPGDPESYQKRT